MGLLFVQNSPYFFITIIHYKLFIMKHLFVYLIAFIAISFICSCSKSGESGSSLSGTTWTYVDREDEDENIFTFTLKFSKTNFNLTYVGSYEGEIEKESASGTYTYDDPVVILTSTVDGRVKTETGIKDGNTLRFTEMTFTKK